jgi:hypothetical protein
VSRPALDIDPFEYDPTRWATSMVHHAELMLRCLDTAGARSVLEIGAYAGDLTRTLVRWAAGAGATVSAIDPAPRERLVELARDLPELELIEEPSLTALRHVRIADAVIVDGDHNWYTVSEELRLIDHRTEGELPLLLFHDVAWPHARRDDYFDPETIPEEYRQPLVGQRGGLFPGDPAVRPEGIPFPRSAEREGGPRNGVLTALEDFAAGRADVRVVVVPAFFGLGVAWHTDAAWSDEMADLLAFWDRNPLLERVEANRVHHVAESYARQTEIWRLEERLARQEAVLRRLLESSAFALAERLSRLRMRAGVAPSQPVVSKDKIRCVLEDG